MFRKTLTLAFIFGLATPAMAQWQVPEGSIPIGRGPGVQGFTSAAPQPGYVLTGNLSGPPSFQPITGIGVIAIGGMQGLIDCGTGIVCDDNTISATPFIMPPPSPSTLGGIFSSTAPANEFAYGVDTSGNLLYRGGATTVNGQTCTIGGTCTVTAAAASLAIGTTTVTGSNGYLLNSSGTLGVVAGVANRVMTMNASGVATASTTLPIVNLPSLTGDVTSVTGSNSVSVNNNAISNAKIAQATAATLKGNPTVSTANVSDFTIQGLTTLSSPSSTNDYILIYDSTAGTLKKVNINTIAASGSAGVGSLGALTGVVGVGTGIITCSVNSICADIGTSGAKIPLLNGTNTFSGANNFSQRIYAAVAGGSVITATFESTAGGNSFYLKSNVGSAGSTGSALNFQDGSTTDAQIISIVGNGMRFLTNSTPRISIANSGNIGINQNTPLQVLDLTKGYANGTVGTPIMIHNDTASASVAGTGMGINFTYGSHSSASTFGMVGGYGDGTYIGTGIWGNTSSGRPALFVSGSLAAFTGKAFQSHEVAQSANGVWLSSGNADITYHSFAGDAVDHYFTQQLIQYTSTLGANNFQTGLTLNVKTVTGQGGGGNNNGSAAAQFVHYVGAGANSAWGIANNVIIDAGWNQTPGIVYGLELDMTNNRGDANPAGDIGIYNLVLGGYVNHRITAEINISGDNVGEYMAYRGIQFTGSKSISDQSIYDASGSDTSYRIAESHATGIQMQGATFTFKQIQGNGFDIATDGTYTHTSDIRMKNLDAPLEGGLAKIEAIRGWRFHWKADNRPDIGVVAQEVQKVLPELVYKSGPQGPDGRPTDTVLSVNYAGLVVPLIEAVHELKAANDNLAQRLTKLERKKK